MAVTLAIANQKGGVAKSTTTQALSAALGEMGHRVLMVGLDSQASLTTMCGIDPLSLEHSVYDLLTTKTVTVDSLILPTNLKNVELVPEHIDLSAIDMNLRDRVGREMILRHKLQPVQNRYDFIVIDTAPALNVLTTSALTAADWVLIPVQTHPLSLYGLGLLLQTVEEVQASTNPNLRIIGVLPTLYDPRGGNLPKQVVEKLKADFGDLVFPTHITYRARMTEAVVHGVSVVSYAARSESAGEYRTLARDVLTRMGMEATTSAKA